jgi:hypothetical protein
MPVTSDTLEIAKYRQEWWKAGISILTPIAIAFLTYFISVSLGERESHLRRGEQILSEKQKQYQRIGEDLNIIYVYVADVGDFRRFTPEEVLAKKREADRTFYSYRPYWSRDTQGRYNAFMEAAFQPYVALGTNAKIRGSVAEKRQAYSIDKKTWNDTWDALFTGSTDPSVADRYDEVVRGFLDDIATSDLDGPRSRK